MCATQVFIILLLLCCTKRLINKILPQYPQLSAPLYNTTNCYCNFVGLVFPALLLFSYLATKANHLQYPNIPTGVNSTHERGSTRGVTAHVCFYNNYSTRVLLEVVLPYTDGLGTGPVSNGCLMG